MYEQYYHLTEKPFGLTPDPKYRYSSESFVAALDLLHAAVNAEECWAVVTGAPGTGKTTLCRALVEHSGQKTVVALLLNPPQSEHELLKDVLCEFGIVSRGDDGFAVESPGRQDMLNAVQDFLESLLPLGARGVLVVDEAQNVPVPVLEEVRVLSNLTAGKRPLLQTVLVGQPALVETLRAAPLKHLDQRFSLRIELQPLSETETSAYVQHRLDVAGPARSVQFTPAALTRVHRLSGGVPRVINLLTHRALLGGYSAATETIDTDLVNAAAEDLDLDQEERRRVSGLWSLVASLRSRIQTKD
jgi:general secretion pathway protein A